MKNIYFFGTILSLVLIVTVVALTQKEENIVSIPVVSKYISKTPQPKKIDFGTELPASLPLDIPVEKGVNIKQSYELGYAVERQSTVVFSSSKTVKENYALYTDFLAKQNWVIANKYESAQTSSLYATKELNDINITITENPANTSGGSLVSISFLKK